MAPEKADDMQSELTVDVAAIIPTYNRANLIGQAIESVLAQTVRANQIIVVDDGSTDNTAEAVGRYGSDVQYVVHENQGVSAARNRGIQLARSKYVAFLDSDDRWLPEKLGLQTAALEQNPQLVAHVCNISWWRAGKAIPQALWRKPRSEQEADEGTMPTALRWVIQDSVAVVPGLMVRANILRQSGGFDTTLSLWEDTDFAARVALQGHWGFCARPQALVRDPFEGEDHLSKRRAADQEFSLGARRKVLAALLVNPNLRREEDRYVILAELARATYGLAGAKARTGNIRAASRLYRESLHLGAGIQACLMLLLLHGSFGLAHRLLEWCERRVRV